MPGRPDGGASVEPATGHMEVERVWGRWLLMSRMPTALPRGAHGALGLCERTVTVRRRRIANATDLIGIGEAHIDLRDLAGHQAAGIESDAYCGALRQHMLRTRTNSPT